MSKIRQKIRASLNSPKNPQFPEGFSIPRMCVFRGENPRMWQPCQVPNSPLRYAIADTQLQLDLMSPSHIIFYLYGFRQILVI